MFTLPVLLAAVAGFAGLVAPQSAGAATSDGAARLKIKTAAALAASIPSSKFARSRRSKLRREVRRSRSLAGSQDTCALLSAADALLGTLETPATWRKGKIPRRHVRRPVKLLLAAERVLLRSVSRKCARPADSHRLKAHKGGSGAPVVQPPDQNPDQGEEEEEPIPQGRLRRPKGFGDAIGPGADRFGGTAASSGAYAAKKASVAASASRNLARIATDPLSIFRNADVGVPPRRASPQEPTTAIAPGSGVAWYTGNSSVALSTDNGRTWNMFNPSNVLPDQGLAFCCDQLVSYSPSYNLFVWVTQYWCNRSCLTSNGATPPRMVCRPQSDAVYNRVRIAVARPEDLRANASNPGAAWTYWDVTPGTVGQPPSTWFDRSDLAVNATSINWNVDSVCGSSGMVLGRISLAQLAARGTVNLQYMNEGPRMSSTQGVASATTYYSGANTMGQARIWSWAPSSGTLFRHDIDHSTVPAYDNAVNGTDSNNWYDRYGIFPGQVESSTISGNTLYLAQGTGRAYCTARCTTSTPALSRFLDQPAVFISKFDVNTWRLTGERWIWNPTLAFTWPALQTDGAGEVGLVMRSNSNGRNARPVAGFLTPDEQFTFTNPEGSPHQTGDYYSLRPGRTSRSFVMTGQTVQNDAGVSNMHWLFIEYGLGAAPYVSPPTVHITAPATLTRYAQGATAHYTADVSDPIDGTLPAAAIRWTADGSAIGSGASLSHVESTPGTHTITVTATNGDGRSASDSITIRVNSSLSSIGATITTPVDNAWLGYSTYNPAYGEYCQDVVFSATASGGSGPLSYSWTDSQDGGAPKTVSTALSPTLTLCAGTAPNHTATHDLTLTVTDGKDTTEAFVRVYVQSWKLA